MKRILIAGIALIIFVSQQACRKQIDYGPQIDALKSSIEALQKRCDSLAGALSNTNYAVTGLSQRIDSINVKILSIQSQILSLNLEIANIHSDINEISARIDLLNQQLQTLINQLNEMLAQVNDPARTIRDGLLAYYPFNGSLYDYGGHSNNGTAVNSLSYGNDHAGNPGSALNLGSGYVTTNSDFFHFSYADSFSISFWLMDNGTQPGGRLLSTENPEGNFRIASYGGGVYAYCFGSAAYYLYDTLQLNTWVQITFVYNKGAEYLYKNGMLNKTATNSSTEGLHYGTPFTIGAKAAPAYDTWKGAIDELRVYDRVLKAAEINYLAGH